MLWINISAGGESSEVGMMKEGYIFFLIIFVNNVTN